MALIARILLFVAIVALAAAIGAFGAFFGTFFLATLLGADNMNGGLAMGAASFLPIGGIIGAALGAWLGWRVASRLEARAAMAGGYGIAGVAVLIGAGIYFYQGYAGGHPYEPGSEPVVLIEWRLPERVPPDRIKRVYRYTMRSTFRDWTLSSEWDIPPTREQEDRTILRFRGEIRWRRDGRTFQLWQFPNHDDRITVDLGLGDDPPHAEDYGPWREVSDAPGNAFRTRVVRE